MNLLDKYLDADKRTRIYLAFLHYSELLSVVLEDEIADIDIYIEEFLIGNTYALVIDCYPWNELILFDYPCGANFLSNFHGSFGNFLRHIDNNDFHINNIRPSEIWEPNYEKD